MKLILFLVVVLFKCSRLSSAPAESLIHHIEESNSNRNSSDDWTVPIIKPSNFPSISNDDDDGGDDAGRTEAVSNLRRSIRSDHTEIEARRRSAVDKGFMRFGRSRNVVFGRSGPDENGNAMNDIERYDNENDDEVEINEPYQIRMRKGNMMRFGRGNMMRFGRSYQDTEVPLDDTDYSNNDASEVYDFIEPSVKRSPDHKNYDDHGSKILRLGRSSASTESELYGDEESFNMPIHSLEKSNEREKKPTDGNVLRFGRSDKGNNILRFGRSDKNMMRFGRGNMMRFGRGNMMRFGRNNNMMRFGRSEKNRLVGDDFTRLSRAGNVMRFGRSDKNLMRFGKRNNFPKAIASNSKVYCIDTNCLLQENEQKVLDDNGDNENLQNDQLKSLFGGDSKQGYGEYIIQK